MGTAGHVDHGKTSLIKALTNIDCDTHKEEKERGITINLGFSHIDLPSGNSVGIVDVPGHKDFINTMVGGACGIDFVLLVIAADSGIMPQTEEHLNIIRTLNIKKAIIALTKIDLVDEELVDLAKLEIMDWLDQTQYSNAPIVGVSNTNGQGIEELKQEIDRLIPEIDEKEKGNFFRMFIDRIFTIKGMGSVVTGSVLNGETSVGKDLLLLPDSKQKLRIRTIQKHGKEVDSVHTGDRAAFNITGLKSEDFKRGMLLVNKDIPSTKMVDAHISLFDNSDNLKLWSSVVFYSGTFESQAKMHLLNKDSLRPGEDAIVQIHLEKESILLNKDKFIIRNTSGNKSLGGGIIIDAQALHHRKRPQKLIDELELLSSSILNEGNIDELIRIELNKAKKPISIEYLSEITNKSKEELLLVIDSLGDVFLYQQNNNQILILESIENNYKEKIIALINEHHTKNPILEKGLAENEFYGKFNFSKDETAKKYISLILKKISEQGEIKLHKNTWINSNFKVEIDEKAKEEIDFLEQNILAYKLFKPVDLELKNLAEEKGISASKYKLYFKYLNSKNKLVYYKNDYVHSSIVEQCKSDILSLLEKSEDGLFYGEIRQAIGISKKLMPFFINILSEEKKVSVSEPENNNIKVRLLK
jgi:selenocysteine-specific elongation factor